MRLTKGMYGREFKPESELFGIRCGQIRARTIVHNGGWYNQRGEKLGWGDLSPEDFQRISDGLENGELFIVLYESDSFWSFVTKPVIIGSRTTVRPDVEAPGVEYVVEKCGYVIAKNRLYYVDRYESSREETFEWYGVQFTALKREAAKALIVS